MFASRHDQYAEERAEVEVLFAKAKKHADLGKQMRASLARLEDRGSFWKDAAGAMYNDTQGSRVLNRNVDDIMAAINRFRQPLEGKAEEERAILDGPQKIGIQSYLASLRRVQNKHAQLMNTPIRANHDAAQELGQLLGHGEKQIVAYFEQIVRQDVRPVEPLHFITKNLAFPTIPDAKFSDLAELNSFFGLSQSRNAASLSETGRLYADVRGIYIGSSLQNLATATITTSKNKKPDEIYRPNDSGITTYASGLQGMAEAEWKNISSIFMHEERGMVFELTMQSAIKDLSKTLSELDGYTKSGLTTDGFLAFEVVDVVNRLAFRIDDKTGQLKQRLLDEVRPARETAKNVVKELIEDVRRRTCSISLLPKDCSAISLTTDVMRRLQTLICFPQSLASVLSSIGDKNWLFPAEGSNGSSTSLPTSRTFDVGASGTELVGNYVLDTIQVLYDQLEAKGRSLLKEKHSLGLFLANNLSVVERMIRTSELPNVLPSASRKIRIDVLRKKNIKTYVDIFNEACTPLFDVQYTNRGGRPPSGNANAVDSAAIVKALNSKDKDAIKRKFDIFNLKFVDVCNIHKDHLSGMQPDIRAQLAKDIQTQIEPLYGRFWDKYHDIDKGKGKHVKYDKAALAAQLQAFS